MRHRGYQRVGFTTTSLGMTKIAMANPELSALVSRLQWPVPSVKWWAIQELALLLLDPNCHQPALEAIVSAIKTCRFETETVELLLVFSLARAKDASFQCPAALGCEVKARSLLSDAVLKNLDPKCTALGEYLAPLKRFPGGLVEPVDFLAAESKAFPRVLRSDLQFIEERTGLPLQAQFASEWEASLSRVPDHRHRIDFFIESPRDQHTGQFFTEQSARARSAFLRTLSVAAANGLSTTSLARFALSTLPLDPALAWLQPRPPEGWPRVGGCQPANIAIEQHVASVLSALAQGGLVGAVSWITECEDNSWLDCTAMLWAGSATDWPEGDSIEQATTVFAGMLAGNGLEQFATCKYESKTINSWRSRGIRPLVGRVYPERFGYMQAELVNRGIFAPIPADITTDVVASNSNEILSYRHGGDALGVYGYWNISWRPSYFSDGSPQCGTYLLLTEGPSEKQGFYGWRCRRFVREAQMSVTYLDSYGIVPLDQIGCCAS